MDNFQIFNEYLSEIFIIVVKLLLIFVIYYGKKLYNNIQFYLSKKANNEQKMILRLFAKEAISLTALLYKELDGKEKFNNAIAFVSKLATSYGLKVSEEEIMGTVQDVFREAKAKGLLPKEYYIDKNTSIINEEKWSVNFSNYIFTKNEKLFYHYSFIIKNISKETLTSVKVVFKPEICQQFITASDAVPSGVELNSNGDLVVNANIDINQAKELKDIAQIKILWQELGIEKIKIFEYPIKSSSIA